MKLHSSGTGVIYDDFGSHSDESNRRKSVSYGYRMDRTPGTTKHCFCCKKQKENIGHSIREGRFICIDCKRLIKKMASKQ